MPTFTRTEADVLGTFAAPVALAAGASATTGPLDLTGANVSDGVLGVVLIIGATPPTTPPTVAFNESLDGVNYEAVVTVVCPNVASSRYSYPYAPSHPAVKKVTATVTNGATTGITAYAQASTRAIA